jgi:hypothetical protein
MNKLAFLLLSVLTACVSPETREQQQAARAEARAQLFASLKDDCSGALSKHAFWICVEAGAAKHGYELPAAKDGLQPSNGPIVGWGVAGPEPGGSRVAGDAQGKGFNIVQSLPGL